jgi:cyclopropane fatty-acyl-phospholipid synthase-like methyltransferase
LTGPRSGLEAAPPDLSPHLDELLRDESTLGPLSEPLCQLLAATGLPAGARVLDPACGRGGAALTLAARLGWQVDGVDRSEPLVALAEAEARQRGLSCRFRPGRVEDALAAAAGNPRDGLVWLGMGRALGTVEETVGALRRAVRPGGFILLDAGFLRHDEPPPPRLEAHRPRGATLSALCAHGDLVAGEHVAPDDEVRAANRRDLQALRSRAAALAARQPALATALSHWVEAQAAQVVDRERSLRSAAWLLQRGES